MLAELTHLAQQWTEASGDARPYFAGLACAVALIVAAGYGARLLWQDSLVNFRLLLSESRGAACLGLFLTWPVLAVAALAASLGLLQLLQGAPGGANTLTVSFMSGLSVIQERIEQVLPIRVEHSVFTWVLLAWGLLLAAWAIRALSWWPHRRVARVRAGRLLESIDPQAPENKPRATRQLIRYRS